MARSSEFLRRRDKLKSRFLVSSVCCSCDGSTHYLAPEAVLFVYSLMYSVTLPYPTSFVLLLYIPRTEGCLLSFELHLVLLALRDLS